MGILRHLHYPLLYFHYLPQLEGDLGGLFALLRLIYRSMHLSVRRLVAFCCSTMIYGFSLPCLEITLFRMNIKYPVETSAEPLADDVLI